MTVFCDDNMLLHSSIIFCFLLLSVNRVYGEGNNGQLASLYEHLRFGYDKNIRPVSDPSKPTEVKFGMSLNFLTLDDETQSLFFNSYLIILWKDEFLSWDPKEYGNVTTIHLSSEDVWTPSIALHNSKNGDDFDVRRNVPLVGNERGEIFWIPPFSGETPCSMTLDNWPSDDYSCKLQFSIPSTSGNMVEMQMLYKSNNSEKVVSLDSFERNTQWNLIGVESRKEVVKYGEEVTVVTIQLNVERTSSRVTSYIANSAFALILVVMLSYGLPLHYHVARIIFHLFVLFLFAVSSVAFFVALPPASTRVPLIVKYYQGVSVITILSLILNATFCHNGGIARMFEMKLTVNISRKVVDFFGSKPLLRRLVSSEISYSSLGENAAQESELISRANPEQDLAKKTLILMRILNFFAGLLFAILYLTTHYIMKSSIL